MNSGVVISGKMGLLQKTATWGRQLTQYPCFHSPLCLTGREGVVVGNGGGTGVKWSAGTPFSRWKGHCLPWASWPNCASLWRATSECSGAGGRPLLMWESTSSDGRRWEQYALIKMQKPDRCGFPSLRWAWWAHVGLWTTAATLSYDKKVILLKAAACFREYLQGFIKA